MTRSIVHADNLRGIEAGALIYHVSNKLDQRWCIAINDCDREGDVWCVDLRAPRDAMSYHEFCFGHETRAVVWMPTTLVMDLRDLSCSLIGTWPTEIESIIYDTFIPILKELEDEYVLKNKC